MDAKGLVFHRSGLRRVTRGLTLALVATLALGLAVTSCEDGGGSSGGGAGDFSAGTEWRFGGVNFESAREDPSVQITELRVSPDGLTFRWDKGDLGAWGLAPSQAGAIAAAFYWERGHWVGGKFDWVSTSRTSRDFLNIKRGYGGWDYAAFMGAPRRAFAIYSADGRRRTNLIGD